MNLKRMAVLGVGALVGSYVYERFIAESDEGTGFIAQSPGFGLDDAVRAVVTGAGIIVTTKMLGKVGV